MAGRLVPWPLAAILPWLSVAHADEAPGWSDRLTEAGLAPALVYNGEIASNVAGGVQRGQTYAGSLHIQLGLDGEKLAETPGLSAWLDVLWVTGGLPSAYSGDAQGVSNFAAPHALRSYEAWLEYNFPDNRFSVLAGQYDLNTEFYHLASSSMFLNASFGIGPELAFSGFNGPSIFPNTSLAVRVAYKPALNIVMQAAVLDGAPLDRVPGAPPPFDPHNGVLVVAETAILKYRSSGDPDEDLRYHIGRVASQAAYDDKLAVGAWYYSAKLSDSSYVPVNTTHRQGENGAYLTADHLLAKDSDDPKRRLSAFLQAGFANRTVNRFGTYIGAGLVASGVIADRTDDQLGLSMAMARSGSHYSSYQQRVGVPVTALETTLELSYLAQLNQWAAVQPDLQYIIHPNTDPRVENATMAQLRLQLTF